MKHIIFPLFFLLSSVAIAQPDTLWSLAWGDRYDDSFTSVIELNNGEFVVFGGDYIGDRQRTNFLVMNLNANGTQNWSTTFGGDRWDLANEIVSAHNSDLLVVGITDSYGQGRENGYAAKLNSQGEVQWFNWYGGESVDNFRSVRNLGDGNFAICGSTYSFGENSSDMWLVKIDDAGEVLWQRTYDNRSSEGAETIVHCDDGGFLLAGYTFFDGWSGRDFYVVRTDSVGNELWNASFGDSLSDICHDALQTADGGFLLAGYKDMRPGMGANADFWLVKIDSVGELRWSREYGGDSVDKGYTISKTSDGGFIIGGETFSDGNGISNFYAVRVDSLGEELWSMNLGERGYNTCYSVISTSDGGYALAGVRDFGGGRRSDGWIVKTGRDPLLNNVVLVDPSFPSELKLHTPYPNPFNSTTRIAFQLPYPSHVNLSIRDQQGREVTVLLNQNLTLGKHEVRWQADDQPSGMYFCTMDANGFRISKGVVFVR